MTTPTTPTNARFPRFIYDFFAVRLTTIALTYTLIGAYNGLVSLITVHLPKLFTIILPAVTLGLSACVIFTPHPIHALLCLIAVFFNRVIIYLRSGAEFLAYVFLIVYVGAVAILFLFVIRLLNIKELTAAPKRILSKFDRRCLSILGPAALTLFLAPPFFLGRAIVNSNLLTAPHERSTITALHYYVTRQHSDVNLVANSLYSTDA